MNSEAIILCGGRINYTNLPIATNTSNAMIPVNGKPVIGWILDDLMAKGIGGVTVVLREQDHRFQGFLQRAYVNRMDVAMALLHQEGTIVQSLLAGLRRSPTEGSVRVILGDTLIRDSYDGDRDFVYVGTVEDSRRWCLAFVAPDGRIIDYVDKQENVAGPCLALSGYYHFVDGGYLRSCVERSVAQGERELSDVLRRYGALRPIYARPVREWFDFGNIDNLVDARRRLLQSRFFNTLSINPVLNTITKCSEDNGKLRDELNWYLQVPDELKVLTPRIVSHREVEGRLEIVQEYYGYPTLAELYLYGDLHPDAWTSILRRILQIHREFRRYPGPVTKADLHAMYLEKTWRRLELLCDQDPMWRDLVKRPRIVFNGRPLRGLPELERQLQQRVTALAETSAGCVIHGDFCFPNILFDINNQIIRLIDPRGSFGRKGIFGDPRYDIAKLRHSVCGLYDYVVADMFDIQEGADGYTGTVYTDGTPRVVAAVFDRMVQEMGCDLDEIRLIEGLLFISMLPLHHDRPKRQQMMFLTGLSLLNEVL